MYKSTGYQDLLLLVASSFGRCMVLLLREEHAANVGCFRATCNKG